jgi:hypothetical protein
MTTNVNGLEGLLCPNGAPPSAARVLYDPYPESIIRDCIGDFQTEALAVAYARAFSEKCSLPIAYGA